MEGFRSNYRRIRLNSTTATPPNPYGEAIGRYLQARQKGFKILATGGVIGALVVALGLIFLGRLTVSTESPAPRGTEAPSARSVETESHRPNAVRSTNEADLRAQLHDAERDLAHLQALLTRTRDQAQRDLEEANGALTRSKNLASIWVDHAQASLRLLRERMGKLRARRLQQIDPRLPRLIEDPSIDHEIALHHYLDLQALETEHSEIDEIEDLHRDCLREVSGDNLDRTDLPTLMEHLREIHLRISRAEGRIDARIGQANFLAQTLAAKENETGLLPTRDEAESPWILPRDRAHALVEKWIENDGPLSYLINSSPSDFNYRQFLDEEHQHQVMIAVPYDGAFIAVPMLDFASWQRTLRRHFGNRAPFSGDRSLSLAFHDYYQFAYAIPHLRDLDMFVSSRETFNPVETR